MKKHLVLLSALGLAGTACAQSSVTLFGIVDATIAHGSGSLAKRTQLSRGGYNTNRIGFRGEEDLGGGLSAQFWLEAGINVDDGSAGATNTNNQASGATASGGLTFARRATVGLAGPWGELRAGRDYTPQYWGYIAGDPFGNVGVGTAVNYTSSITGVTNTRASNSLAYFSPALAGFRVNLMHYRGENASNAANSDDGNGSGVRLSYESGPFSAGVGYGRTEYLAGDMIQRNISAQWNFGVAKVMGDLNRDRAGTLDARGGALGMSAPLGVGEAKASYSWHRTDAAGNPEAKKLAVGYVHNLSKRTAVYATYARVRNSGGSAVALNGATTAPNASSSGFDLGLRHSF
jgi:predicted porin